MRAGSTEAVIKPVVPENEVVETQASITASATCGHSALAATQNDVRILAHLSSPKGWTAVYKPSTKHRVRKKSVSPLFLKTHGVQ